MDKKEAIKLIEPIFKGVFDDDKLEINENSNSDNIDSWDSLNHILLVVEIEKNWILDSPMVISRYKNVGELCEAISDKLGWNDCRYYL